MSDPVLKHPALGWITHTLIVICGGCIAFGMIQAQVSSTREDIKEMRDVQKTQQLKLEQTAEGVAGINGKLDILIRRDGQRADAH